MPSTSAFTKAQALKAIISVDPDVATKIADGSGVLVKDNIAVRGLPLTGASPAFADLYPAYDATAVRLMRQAGHQVIAKTNLHELAFGITSNNAHYGAVRNPYAPDRIAGGSSGGSAAALAVGLGALSLVSDTGGSARIPAALCGVIGFRPSTGRYPGDGVINLSPSRDTIGIMARAIDHIISADAILSGEVKIPTPALPKRIGILSDKDLSVVDAPVAAVYNDAIMRLKDQGVTLLPVSLDRVFHHDEACGFPIALYESAQALAAFAAKHYNQSYAWLADHVASPDVQGLLKSQLGPGRISRDVYFNALGSDWPLLRQAYAAVFTDNQIDALFMPTCPLTAAKIGEDDMVVVNGNAVPTFPTYTHFARPDSMAGLPSISLPAGVAENGLPVGLMVVGPVGQDRALLSQAAAILPVFPVTPPPLTE